MQCCCVCAGLSWYFPPLFTIGHGSYIILYLYKASHRYREPNNTYKYIKKVFIKNKNIQVIV